MYVLVIAIGCWLHIVSVCVCVCEYLFVSQFSRFPLQFLSYSFISCLVLGLMCFPFCHFSLNYNITFVTF